MEDKVVRLSGMRRVIGDRMCASLQQTAQYTLTREIEVDALLDCCRAGYRMSGSLYALDGECWLMPDYPPAPRTRVLLAEFADMRVLTAVGAARVREQGSPLLSHPARRPARPRTAVG